MNERKLGILLSYFNIFLHAVIGFLYVPILLHYIGKSEYGLYQLMGSLIAYFGVMDFGLSAAVIRFYTKYKALGDKAGMENILAISLRGYGLVIVLALLLGGVCYTFLDAAFAESMSAAEVAEAKEIFLLLLLNIGISLGTMVFSAIINANEKFYFLKGLEAVHLIVQPVLVVMLLDQAPRAFTVTLVQTGLNLALSLARMYYCFHGLHVTIRYHYWNPALFREFRHLALSVFAVTVIDQIFFKTNQIILGIISGTAAVAVYSLSSLIYMNYMALSSAISGVYLPHVTKMVARREPASHLSVLFIKIGRWQYYLLSLAATGFIIFGREFIHMWAGAGFEEAYGITLLIILPFTIDLIQNIGNSILQAKNCYDFRAKVLFCSGVLSLSLAIPLGLRYGGTGCAFATGLAMVISNGLVMNWFYAQEIHLAIKDFWQQIGRITLAFAPVTALGYMANALCPTAGLPAFLLKATIYSVFYGAALWLFAMKDEEKAKLYEIWQAVSKGNQR